MEQNSSPQYWLSLEQWRNDSAFRELAEQEFQSSPLKESDGQDGWARREFLKLMGASLALTSFGCIRRPAQRIVPYAKGPVEITPGIANYYVSSYSDAIEGFGLIVKTREGRPIKAEGNPDHPTNLGGLSARGNAHVLSLWDPDRLTGPKKNLLNEGKNNRDTISITWDKADEEIVALLKKGKVALLTGAVTSPSTRAAIEDFKAAFGAEWLQWEAMGLDSLTQGQKAGSGKAAFPMPRLDRTKLIVTIDCDFLGTFLAPTEFTKRFAAGRKPGAGMNRLVSFESLVSLTGLNADERYRMKPSQQISIVMGLLHQLIVTKKLSKYAGDKQVTAALEKFSGVAEETKIPAAVFAKVADELWANRGASVVLAGGMTAQTERALDLQAAVNFLNIVLENDGKTIEANRRPVAGRMTTSKDLETLAQGIAAGRFETVVIFGTNPVYSAPGNLKMADALRKAKAVIYVDDRNDETGRMADFVLAANHPMESWGDGEFQNGVYSLQQPTLRPLNDTRSFDENLVQWCKKAEKGPQRIRGAADSYEYVRNFWRTEIYPKAKSGKDFEDFWFGVLQNGVVDLKASASGMGKGPDAGTLARVERSKPVEGYELSLYLTSGLADGTLSNVSWLQEFPDPVTKICWDNYVTMSPTDAKREHIHEGSVIRLSASGQILEMPVHIQPGQADGVLGLAVGYGRSGMGKIADGVGTNAYPLSVYKDGTVVYSGIPAKIEKTEGKYDLANTQGHHSMEGRDIVIEATLADYTKNPSAGIHREKIESIWSEHQYPKYKWGMVIDLNTCTGCSACLVACQSENNIPAVGKKHVLKGREMHWIRIDRYYTGKPEDPAAVFQPLTCQHCDNAPCETVCPVLATVHSDEGTNDMIYNRCVGTRYCSNNCPYKVRRFNWFNYVKTVEKPLNNAMNPDVTVRSRGVMEKCTFCTHRIHDVKNRAKVEGREVREGEVKTACQQSCPADAITFGNLKDPNSAVAKLFDSERNYSLLEELNTKPALHYLTKIRNVDTLKTEKAKGHEGHHS